MELNVLCYVRHNVPFYPLTRVKGIEKYLGSGLIKGIGPVMAKRLVSKFGLETLNVIETDIKKLHEVEDIGDKRIEMIKKAVAIAIKNNKPQKRYTSLKDRLMSGIHSQENKKETVSNEQIW